MNKKIMFAMLSFLAGNGVMMGMKTPSVITICSYSCPNNTAKVNDLSLTLNIPTGTNQSITAGLQRDGQELFIIRDHDSIDKIIEACCEVQGDTISFDTTDYRKLNVKKPNEEIINQVALFLGEQKKLDQINVTLHPYVISEKNRTPSRLFTVGIPCALLTIVVACLQWKYRILW